jgi:hypothetical protein
MPLVQRSGGQRVAAPTKAVYWHWNDEMMAGYWYKALLEGAAGVRPSNERSLLIPHNVARKHTDHDGHICPSLCAAGG